jgi:hypothetical protein
MRVRIVTHVSGSVRVLRVRLAGFIVRKRNSSLSSSMKRPYHGTFNLNLLIVEKLGKCDVELKRFPISEKLEVFLGS